jgi:C1A family cysteine protease
MKTSLYRHGPLETGFDVYDDFYHYSSGVYHHISGDLVGGHAVKVIGWGTDQIGNQSVSYWLCANSWGVEWGMDGYFKIKQGDCGIDDAMYGCEPSTSVLSII